MRLIHQHNFKQNCDLWQVILCVLIRSLTVKMYQSVMLLQIQPSQIFKLLFQDSTSELCCIWILCLLALLHVWLLLTFSKCDFVCVAFHFGCRLEADIIGGTLVLSQQVGPSLLIDIFQSNQAQKSISQVEERQVLLEVFQWESQMAPPFSQFSSKTPIINRFLTSVPKDQPDVFPIQAWYQPFPTLNKSIFHERKMLPTFLSYISKCMIFYSRQVKSLPGSWVIF